VAWRKEVTLSDGYPTSAACNAIVTKHLKWQSAAATPRPLFPAIQEMTTFLVAMENHPLRLAIR
jgi:hypothetical protein